MTITFKNFVELANKIHSNKYQYTEYNGMLIKCPIICPQHGTFYQNPAHHIHRKQGCPSCKFEKLSSLYRKDRDKFIEEANKVHNNKYDYSLVEYVKCGKKN